MTSSELFKFFSFVNKSILVLNHFQATEDINLLGDAVHIAVYLTKLAVMESPKSPDLVSAV